MKKFPQLFSLILLLFFSSSFKTAPAQIILAENGTSLYRIVIPSSPSPYEIQAASQLQSFLEKIGRVLMPIVADTAGLTGFEILIGDNSHLRPAGFRISFDKMDGDGFSLQTRGQYVAIAGGRDKGSLYGVYTLLEKLGFRYYTPDCLYIPKTNSVKLPYLSETEEPSFTYREMLFPSAQDSAYLLWHKLDRHKNGEWGMWVHTFKNLVPPDKYYSDHPEYFSLINGRRVADGQLCLSNPEVLDLVIRNLSDRIKANPQALYWSVSQNDNFLACSCPECKKLDAQYGGPSGTMIHFVNAVAERFPDKVISTLAYQYTRSAPRHIKPLDNVNIMLCTIECNRSKPIEEDPSGASFVKDLKDWSRMTDNIILWDYVVQFRNYVSPFPNFYVLRPNLQLFEERGCRMMFQQGSNASWSDFSELKSYLVAKLLWDPLTDQEAVINDFIYGYYGQAAPFIRQYFDMLHEELAGSGDKLWIYGYPFDAVDSYLATPLIKTFNALFDQAAAAVADQPEILARVQKTRLPLDFAVLDISLHQYDGDLAYFIQDAGGLRIREDMMLKLDDFVDGCRAAGVRELNEQGTTPGEYRDMVLDFTRRSLEPSLARGKTVELQTAFNPKYDAGGAAALTDGLRGTEDYHYNWLGFQGNDLIAVIDLEEITSVGRISASFLQSNYSWVFLPLDVSFYGSDDGETFRLLGNVPNTIPDTRPGAFIIPFSLDLAPVRIRYLKIAAHASGTCPSWHLGAGQDSWIFVDEVVVQ